MWYGSDEDDKTGNDDTAGDDDNDDSDKNDKDGNGGTDGNDDNDGNDENNDSDNDGDQDLYVASCGKAFSKLSDCISCSNYKKVSCPNPGSSAAGMLCFSWSTY